MTKKIDIIGHAGAKGFSCENTLQSIQLAIDLGATMVEVDIREKDGKLWIFHDRRLERLCKLNQSFTHCSNETLKNIRFANGEGIPDLNAVLELCKNKIPLNLELKSLEGCKLLIKTLKKAIQNGFPEKDLLLSSFNHHHIKKLAIAFPHIPSALLFASIPLNLKALCQGISSCQAIHQSISYIDEDFVKEAHDLGLKVRVFTVNHSEDLEALKRMNIDGIFTDCLFPLASQFKQGKLN